MKKIIKVIDKRGIESTKYLKRKYRLKDSVKCGICVLVFWAFIVAVLFIQADRVERIENTNDTETKAVNVFINR